MLVCNFSVKESYIQVINFCTHHQASCFVSRIMLNMALLLCIVNEGEHVVVNQVVEKVNPDNCGMTPEPNFSVNEGKPRMHLTYLVIYK